MLGERLRQAIRRRLDFVGCDAPVRIARTLVEIVETYGRQAPAGTRSGVRLAQHELATLSGTSLETVERILHLLRTEGIVTTAYREFTVVNRKALQDFAHLGAYALYHEDAGAIPYYAGDITYFLGDPGDESISGRLPCGMPTPPCAAS
jgi:hypothetical protein